MSLYLFSVWLHVAAATAWIGSMLFFAFVVVPAMRVPEAAAGAHALLVALGRRYRVFGWSSLAVLFVTGVANLFLRGIGWSLLASRAFWSSDFGRALGIKLAVVALVIAATTAHDVWTGTDAAKAARANRGSPAARGYRRRASLLGRSTLVLSLIALFFAVTLVRGAP